MLSNESIFRRYSAMNCHFDEFFGPFENCLTKCNWEEKPGNFKKAENCKEQNINKIQLLKSEKESSFITFELFELLVLHYSLVNTAPNAQQDQESLGRRNRRANRLVCSCVALSRYKQQIPMTNTPLPSPKHTVKLRKHGTQKDHMYCTS